MLRRFYRIPQGARTAEHRSRCERTLPRNFERVQFSSSASRQYEHAFWQTVEIITITRSTSAVLKHLQ